MTSHPLVAEDSTAEFVDCPLGGGAKGLVGGVAPLFQAREEAGVGTAGRGGIANGNRKVAFESKEAGAADRRAVEEVLPLLFVKRAEPLERGIDEFFAGLEFRVR